MLRRPASRGHPAVTVDELLLLAPGRDVRFRRAVEPREGGPELGVELFGGIAHDLQAAALFRAVWPERRHDDVAAGLQRPPNRRDVLPAGERIAKEMKHGPVVPEVVGCRWQRSLGDVGANPANPAGALAEAAPRGVERGDRK